MSGETGPIAVSLGIAMLIAGFFAVAIYNTIEITIWVFSLFCHRRGLYFWSILVATFGIFIHSMAVFLRFFALAPDFPMCVVTILGWWAMVTGQSVVLYSRLGLVVSDRRKTRLVGLMIITNFWIMHIPVSILFLASNSGHPARYINAFNVYEKIQLAVFSVQECIISGLYLYEAKTAIREIMPLKGAEGRKMIWHLVLLFIATLVLDASLMATEYTNHFQIQTTYKPVVYSVKLKMEFVILNELLAFTRMGVHDGSCLDDSGKPPIDTGGAVLNGNVERGSRTNHIYDGTDPTRQIETRRTSTMNVESADRPGRRDTI